MDLYNNLTPAILALREYSTSIWLLEYLNMELDYIDEHLRILSGFYGILRPFDGVTPYRLEMQARPKDWKYKSLYDFWANEIVKSFFRKQMYFKSCIKGV